MVGSESEFVLGDIIGGAVDYHDWQTSSPGYQHVKVMTGGLKIGSDKLVLDYQAVVSKVKDAVQMGERCALLVLRTPKTTLNGTLRAIVNFGDNQTLLFNLDFHSPPNTAAVVTSARTSEGSAKGPEKGGYPIVVTLTNFVITYSIDTLLVTFGNSSARVVSLEHSDPIETKLRVQVPESKIAGDVTMTIWHKNYRGNEARHLSLIHI